MRKRPEVAARAGAPRGAFTRTLAPTPAWTYDIQGAAVPTIVIWTLLISLIVPQNFNYAALVALNVVSTADQSITNKIVMIALLLASCILIARRPLLWRQVVARINPFYLLFIALAALSATWSVDQGVTVTRVFRLLVIFLCFTAFTLTGWRTNRFQSVVRTLLGTILVGSLIFAVAFPHYGVQAFFDYSSVLQGSSMPHSFSLAPDIRPVLRGLTFGKNQMGQLASLGVLFWFHAWLGKEVKPLWIYLCGGSALVCLYWSHSSTSLLATAFALPFMLMLRHWPKWLRRYMPYILSAFSLLLLGYSLVVLQLVPQLDFLLSPIAKLTGKDLTFSNRTAIWQILNVHIGLHPILGTGYSAYWVDEPGSPSQEMKRLLFFYPGEAHNGYLDVINDLGMVGGLCLLGFLFTYLRQSIKIMAFDRHLGSLYLALLFHQFWSSLSESHWFSWGSVSFTIMTLAVCTSARTLLQHRFDLGLAQSPRPAASTEGQLAYDRRLKT
jgi:exopolysaccharide production protein ExoQ